MKPRRKQREKRAHAGLWTALVAVASVVVIGFGFYKGVMSLIDSWNEDLPSLDNIESYSEARTTTIYANDYDPETGEGTVLAELYLENREPVTIDQVSPYVLEGTVAVEDVRFYEHKGVDIQGVIRAVFVNLTGGQEGASTITQQFIRNTVLSSERNDITLERKWREMELALDLEQLYSKEDILMMYLNTINYGDGCYGIQAAAQHYYSVDAADLTIAQAATLIGIPNSPTMYNPVTNPDLCKERRNVVLSRMYTNGVITQEEYEAALAEDLNLDVNESDSLNGIYRFEYFTTWIRDLLLGTATIGDTSYEFSTDELFAGGYTIVTSIDPTYQKYAEEAVQIQYESGNLACDSQEFALTLIDPSTGYVLAMIGGKDYYDDQFNIATSTAGRQVGSTFKAFSLTNAIEQGISPSTKMNCGSTVEVPNGDGTSVRISNYGGDDYGTMTIADMTAISSNTGYLRLTCVDSAKTGVTPQSIADTAVRFGLNPNNIPVVSTTTLGVGQANTTEMAAAYAVFASGGIYREPCPIVQIIDHNGEILVDNSQGSEGVRVITDSVAYAVTQVLEGVLYKSIGTANAAILSNGQIAAGKTGTTDQWYDLWFVGYTPQLSCAVWTGDRNNQDNLYTAPWAQQVWKYVMERALEDYPIQDFAYAAPPSYHSSYTGSAKDEDEDEDEDEKEENNEGELVMPGVDDPKEPENPENPGTEPGTETPGTEPGTETPGTEPDPGTGGGGTGGGTGGGGGGDVEPPPTTVSE